jgi:hypothetical protein
MMQYIYIFFKKNIFLVVWYFDYTVVKKRLLIIQ